MMNQALSNRIYVAGLDGKVSASDLRTYFGTFGEMTDVYIPNNHQTGQPKHFGFVTFADEAAAQVCLETRTHEINGQPVELKPCVPKDQMAPKGGGKGDAAAAGFLGVAGTAPGLGMTMPLQPALIQQSLGGGMQLQQLQALQQQALQQQGMQQPSLIQPGLQALQQQYMVQQQQQLQQQQLLQLQQYLAKMQQQPQQFAQQPQQFAQPNPMMQMQFGGCAGIPGLQGLPAPAEQGSVAPLGWPGAGAPAEQGSNQPCALPGLMQFPAVESPAVAGGMNVQAFNQQQFMGNGFPNSGAMTFGAPAMEGSPGAVNHLASQPAGGWIPPALIPSPDTQQAPAFLPQGDQPSGLSVPPAQMPSSQPDGLQPGLLPPGGLPSGIENPALAFGAMLAADPAQGAARVAPY